MLSQAGEATKQAHQRACSTCLGPPDVQTMNSHYEGSKEGLKMAVSRLNIPLPQFHAWSRPNASLISWVMGVVRRTSTCETTPLVIMKY